MKILHVIASMNPKTGGVCQAVRTIISSLTPLKVDNEVLSLDTQEDDFVKNSPFVLHALGPAKGPWAYNAQLKPWLGKNINRFDSIIIHGLWLYPSFITSNCFNKEKQKNKNLKTKLFVMPHGMLDPYFQKASGRKLKALRNKIYWQLIESKVVNKADALLFTCEEEMVLARKPFNPYKPKAEKIVGLGVEKPPAFTPEMLNSFLEKCPEAKYKNYILFLGRIHEKKGVDLLVNAYIKKLADWEKEGDKTETPQLVIAGPDLDSVFGQYIQKIISSAIGATKNILFPGMLEGDAKWGAFYGCSAFILPSHQENFGIAVVESLACARPVLISNQVNIWREIETNNAGIVDEDTEVGTARLLTKWNNILNRNEITTFQQSAESCYDKYFAIGTWANKLLSSLQ